MSFSDQAWGNSRCIGSARQLPASHERCQRWRARGYDRDATAAWTVRRCQSRRIGRCARGEDLALLGSVLAHGHTVGWRDNLGPFQLSRLSWHFAVGTDVWAATAHPRQRRDHGSLLVVVHRRMLLSGAAALRGSCAVATTRRAAGLVVESRPDGRPCRAGGWLKSRALGRGAVT